MKNFYKDPTPEQLERAKRAPDIEGRDIAVALPLLPRQIGLNVLRAAHDFYTPEEIEIVPAMLSEHDNQLQNDKV